MVKRVNIVFDATVLAMAEVNPRARTGIYFLLRDLVMALERSGQVNLAMASHPEYGPTLARVLVGGPLAGGMDPTRMRSLGNEPWACLAGYYAVHPEMFATPRMTVFQMVYDLTSHVMPQLGANAWNLEESIMASIAEKGHAVCISQNTLEDAVRLFGFPRERASVVYPAARTDLAKAGQGSGRVSDWAGLPQGAPYVLALSTLEPRKNLATSLKAFARACELAPEANLHFLIGGLDGWGDQQSHLIDIPAALRPRVKLLGYVPDDRLPALLEGAFCLLYPSLYEGFGMPPLDAMSRGTPVIVSNAGPLPEVVGDAGAMFDPLDHEGMAQTIARWLSDGEERNAWIARGYEQAKRFSWQASADQLIGIMRREMGL